MTGKQSIGFHADQFNGRDLLLGMVKKDVKDQYGYGRKAFGIEARGGFLEVLKGEWLVRIGEGLLVMGDSEFTRLFVGEMVEAVKRKKAK